MLQCQLRKCNLQGVWGFPAVFWQWASCTLWMWGGLQRGGLDRFYPAMRMKALEYILAEINTLFKIVWENIVCDFQALVQCPLLQQRVAALQFTHPFVFPPCWGATWRGPSGSLTCTKLPECRSERWIKRQQPTPWTHIWEHQHAAVVAFIWFIVIALHIVLCIYTLHLCVWWSFTVLLILRLRLFNLRGLLKLAAPVFYFLLNTFSCFLVFSCEATQRKEIIYLELKLYAG